MAHEAQQAFGDLLLAAFDSAAIEGKITQLQLTITPPGHKRTMIRVVIVPEEVSELTPEVKAEIMANLANTPEPGFQYRQPDNVTRVLVMRQDMEYSWNPDRPFGTPEAPPGAN